MTTQDAPRSRHTLLPAAPRHVAQPDDSLEEIIKAVIRTGSDEIVQLRKILLYPGFFALLKTESPASVRLLKQFFQLHVTTPAVITCARAAVPPSETRCMEARAPIP